MKKVSFLFFAAILFVLIVPTINSQLAFYYSFNNQTYTYNKTLATDESGNGYNATLNSTIGNFYYHPNGRSWNGIFLNGSTNSNKFYLGNVSMTSTNGSQTSISGWINCSSQPDASFVSRYDTGNKRSITLRVSGTSFGILASDDGTFNVGHRESLNSSIDVCDGSWHHFGVIVNGSQFDLYVDGINDTAVDNVLDDNITYLYTTTVNTSIGYRYTNKNSTAAFTGSLDEIKVWNHALTPSQMLTEFNRVKSIYINNSGSDTNYGTNSSLPIKTIANLNNLNLYPNDVVYFNRGNIWREPLDAYLNLKSGSTSGNVTYTAYGTGVLPEIRASLNYSNTGNWTDLGSNKWKSTGTLPTEIGNIILNDSAAARRNTTFANLTRQDDYWYNSTGNHVVFYSVGNPATIHNSVELAEFVIILNIHGRSYLKIENLALLYSSMGAIGNNTAIAHHIIINNTIAKFIGGGYNGGVETDRTGNVYSFSNDAHNVTVINSNLTECWDTAIAVTEWTGSGTQGDFNFSNNIIRRCGFALEFFSTDYLTNNLYFTHNTVVESGWGFSGKGDYIGSYGQGDVRGRSINIKKSKVGSINFVVRDNLIYNSSYVNVNYNESGTWLGERPDLTNNLYWLNGSLLAGYFAVESGNTKTFSEWQTMGFDTDSNEINPLFTTGTFQPTDETACTMSSTGSYVGAVSCDSSGATGCTIPTENMVITTNTTFCSGIYYLSDSDKNGVMTVTANNLNVTCNNTQFGGSWAQNSTWLKSNTTKGINIEDCNISAYAYGIYARNVSNWNITGFIAKGATNRQLRSIVLLNYTRVIIKNSRFYGGNTSFQPFDMLPEGNRTAAIYSYNGSYLNITNVNVSQFRNGFKLQNANYSNINNTILNNTEDTSISFEDNSCYVTINNSLVENSGWNAYHFEMYSKLQNSIARIGITHGCFDAYSDGDGTTNLYENNLCDRTDRTDSDDCMYLRGVVDTIVRNNTLLGCTNYGINIADAFPNNNITIYNNTIVMGTTEYDHCFGIQSSATTKAKQILIENNSLTCNNKTFNMQANFTTIGQNSWVDNYVYIKLYDTSINFSFNSTVTRLDLNLTSGPNKLNFTGTKPYDFELIYDPYTPIKQIRLKYNGFPFKVTNTSSNTEKYSWDILERNFSFFSSNKFWIQYANATPITYLNLPTNGSLYSITSVVFDCEANAANNISTIKLFIYNATNATIYNATNAVIAPDVKTNFFRDLADGTYSYNCLTNDSVGITRYAAANYTFSVDTSNNIYVGQGVLFNPELSNVTYISPGFYCSNIEVDDWCLNVSGGLYAGYYCHNSSFYANMTLGVTTYVNFFVYDEQTEELINDRDVTILLFSENYTSNYTTGSGTLNISNILVGNYEIRYVADEYHTRAYYTLLPGTLTNTIYLYLINSSVAISSRVTLHITDEYSHNVPNLIVKLQRNYISGNVSVFKTVSMSKTNFEGNAILYVEPYDVWYKLIYETVDGRILKITNPAPFLVDNPSDTVNLGTDSLYSWTVINSVSINLTFINDTGIMYARLVYIDGNNIVRQGCLKLRRLTARGEIPICYNCTVSPSATIACEFDPLLSGQYIATGMIDINSNGSWYSYNEYWNQGGNPNNFGQEGIFGWAVIIGSLALMGIGSFISSFLLVILGLIGAYATGMIVGISSGTIWWVAILGILMLMFLFGKGKGGE